MRRDRDRGSLFTWVLASAPVPPCVMLHFHLCKSDLASRSIAHPPPAASTARQQAKNARLGQGSSRRTAEAKTVFCGMRFEPHAKR